MINGKNTRYKQMKIISYRWGDLELIESKYNLYIPWLFPNFYTSRINPIAKPLQDHEVEIFRNDIEVKKNY